MSKTYWYLLLALGCQDSTEVKDEDPVAVAPDSCVVDDEVCLSFTSDWSSDESADVCDEYEGMGIPGDCPSDELGTCSLETGLSYHLYDMNPVDAKAYCDYFGGDWIVAGTEESG